VEGLGERGVRLHGHRLALPSDAVTVRVRGGEVLRTDGPFAETKEYVAGFDILECDSLEEAIEAAAGHPVATIGAMEVRPFWEDEDAEGQIRALDAELTEAARERDVDRMTACYAPDVEAIVGGRAHSGIDAHRKAVEKIFACAAGPVTRKVTDFRVHVDENTAFGHALVRMRATGPSAAPIDGLWHVSTGYRNAGLRWLIAHEHVSALDTKERS
jgi:uncharacterized protein (TIGR02246 family)